MIYFDHAASTKIYSEVVETLTQSFAQDYANPSSQHKLGKDLSKKIEKSKKSILSHLDASNYNLIFTSSATESNNQIINEYKEKGKVISFLFDHPSVTYLKDEFGAMALSDKLEDFVDQETSLVVLSLVNSQTGLIFDVESQAKTIKEINPNAKVLVDAVQGFGKVDFSLKNSEVDFVSVASHKIGGPRGVAALIYKKTEKLRPLLVGGGHEEGLRASTPATSLILGFEKASEISFERKLESLNKLNECKKLLKEELESLHKNIEFLFVENSSPYISCVKFSGIPSDVLLRHLEMKDVYISSTTACSSKIKGFNPIFAGLGIEEKFHKNILRISFCSQTTIEEVREFVERFKQVIEEVSFLIK